MLISSCFYQIRGPGCFVVVVVLFWVFGFVCLFFFCSAFLRINGISQGFFYSLFWPCFFRKSLRFF